MKLTAKEKELGLQIVLSKRHENMTEVERLLVRETLKVLFPNFIRERKEENHEEA